MFRRFVLVANLPEQLRQPRDVNGDLSCFVVRAHLRLSGVSLGLATVELYERLPGGVTEACIQWVKAIFGHDRVFFGPPGCRGSIAPRPARRKLTGASAARERGSGRKAGSSPQVHHGSPAKRAGCSNAMGRREVPLGPRRL
jgi:hypothetical protein